MSSPDDEPFIQILGLVLSIMAVLVVVAIIVGRWILG